MAGLEQALIILQFNRETDYVKWEVSNVFLEHISKVHTVHISSFYWNIYSLFVLNWKYPFCELLLRAVQDKHGVQNLNHSHQPQGIQTLLFRLSCDGLGWQL